LNISGQVSNANIQYLTTSQSPPPSLLPVFTVILTVAKPFLQLSTQPPITPQALNPPAPNLPLLSPEIEPYHTLALFIAESLEIALAILPATAVNNSARRPREPCEEI